MQSCSNGESWPIHRPLITGSDFLTPACESNLARRMLRSPVCMDPSLKLEIVSACQLDLRSGKPETANSACAKLVHATLRWYRFHRRRLKSQASKCISRRLMRNLHPRRYMQLAG